MHELGIVFHMVDLLEGIAREQDLTHVSKVVLDLGEVSGIFVDQLQDAWRWASERSEVLHGAELEVCQIPAVTVCNSCGKTYPTVAYGRVCPHCSSENTVLLRGREMQVREIEAC